MKMMNTIDVSVQAKGFKLSNGGNNETFHSGGLAFGAILPHSMQSPVEKDTRRPALYVHHNSIINSLSMSYN